MFRLSGVSDQDIPDLLLDIQAFADLGEYFDYPVRTYSSGMQCRLAFAAATAVRPDILIVDEALAVGDIFFQQRCYDRITAFREQGTTLLFVSHSAQAVFTLCDRAVLLSEGRLVIDGTPREVIDLYNAQVVAKSMGSSVGEPSALSISGNGADSANGDAGMELPSTTGSYSAGAARLVSVTLLQGDEEVRTVFAPAPMTIRVSIEFLQDVMDPHVGIQLRDARGNILYRAHTHGLGVPLGDAQARDLIQVDFVVVADLIPGQYTLTVGLGSEGKPGGVVRVPLFRYQDVTDFSVISSHDDGFWDGVVNLRPTVTCRRLVAP